MKNIEQIINNRVVKFGQKTVNQLKGTLPIKTGRLVGELDYSIQNNTDLSLFSTNYFGFVLNQTWRPKTRASIKVIETNVNELIIALGDDIVKEISISIEQNNTKYKTIL